MIEAARVTFVEARPGAPRESGQRLDQGRRASRNPGRHGDPGRTGDPGTGGFFISIRPPMC